MTSGVGKVRIRRFRLAALMAFVGVGFLISAFMPSAPRSSAQNNGSLSCSASKTFLPVADGTQSVTLSASGGVSPYKLGAMSSAGAFEVIVSTSIERNASYTIMDSTLPTRKICTITIQVGGASPPPGGGGGGGGGVTPPGSIVSCSIDQRNGGNVKPKTQVIITASGGVPPYSYLVEEGSQWGSTPKTKMSSNIHYPERDGSSYYYYARDSHNSEAVCGNVKVSSYEPPGLNTFIVTVLEKTSKAPLKGATVWLDRESRETPANGTVEFNTRLDLSHKIQVIPPRYCQASDASNFESKGELHSPYEVLIDCAPAKPAVGIRTDMDDDWIYEGEYISLSIYRFAKDISKPLTVNVSIPTNRGYASPNIDYPLPQDFKKKAVDYIVTIPPNKGSVSYLLLTKKDTIKEGFENADFEIIRSDSYTLLSYSPIIKAAILDLASPTLSHDIYTEPKNKIIWTTDSIRYPQMPSQHFTKYKNSEKGTLIEHGYNCQIIGYANKSIDRPCQAGESMLFDEARLLNPKGSTNLIMKISRQGMIVGESNTLMVNTNGFNTCVIKLDGLGNGDTVILYNVTQKKYERVQFETEVGTESAFNYIPDLLQKNKYLVYIIRGTTNINLGIGYSNAPLSPSCIKNQEELRQLPVMVEL